MDELRAKLTKRKDAIEKKGMKVNVGKTKCLVSGEGGAKETSKIDPCTVCGKRVKANSIKCSGCKLWVHKRCSSEKGSLEKVKGTFRCKVCVKVVVVNDFREEMDMGVERVESFVYLGDCIDAGGDCRSAVTAGVRLDGKSLES